MASGFDWIAVPWSELSSASSMGTRCIDPAFVRKLVILFCSSRVVETMTGSCRGELGNIRSWRLSYEKSPPWQRMETGCSPEGLVSSQ